MAKPYSEDLRKRVIRYVETGRTKAESLKHQPPYLQRLYSFPLA